MEYIARLASVSCCTYHADEAAAMPPKRPYMEPIKRELDKAQ